MMKNKTLFLAWQDYNSRRWFPVGRLDASGEADYNFQYLRGAWQAHEECGFEPLYDFPDFDQQYRSADLFPLFSNRVVTPGRRDFREYLRHLDLAGEPDPIEILAASGGQRATDTFEVFPKIEKREDGVFRCRFFLHGWRHLGKDVERRISELQSGDRFGIALEVTNPITHFGLQLQTSDYLVIGWAPRYLAADFAGALAGTVGDYGAVVVRVNPAPAPSKQRLLVEIWADWPDFEPMSSEEYQPLRTPQSIRR